jgi:hypothetical protein
MSLYKKLSKQSPLLHKAICIFWTLFFAFIIIWVLYWAMSLPFCSYDWHDKAQLLDSIKMTLQTENK